jgi:hypothetical protein
MMNLGTNDKIWPQTNAIFLNVSIVFRLPSPYQALIDCLPRKSAKIYEMGAYCALTECLITQKIHQNPANVEGLLNASDATSQGIHVSDASCLDVQVWIIQPHEQIVKCESFWLEPSIWEHALIGVSFEPSKHLGRSHESWPGFLVEMRKSPIGYYRDKTHYANHCSQWAKNSLLSIGLLRMARGGVGGGVSGPMIIHW